MFSYLKNYSILRKYALCKSLKFFNIESLFKNHAKIKNILSLALEIIH